MSELAWDQVQTRDYPDWTIGLRVVVPFAWRTSRGEHQRQQEPHTAA